jgi:ABC-type lipoprotein release transport system permease subunit
VLEGRLPRGDDEIAVGSRTLKDLHLTVGRTADLQVWSDDARPQPVKVVGRAVFTPGSRSFGEAADMGQGIYMTPAALRRFTPKDFDAPSPYIVAVRFRPGVDPVVGRAELSRRLGGQAKGWFVQSPSTPETLVDFGNVRDLPLLLGGVLAIIAAIGIAHLLVTSIRRRRRDLSILKTLGFVPAQVRHAIAWQATTLAAIALLIGVPLGLVSGRLIWTTFADQVGVLTETVVPVVAVVVVAAGAVVLANVIALVPARAAGRTRPARVLRTQ